MVYAISIWKWHWQPDSAHVWSLLQRAYIFELTLEHRLLLPSP